MVSLTKSAYVIYEWSPKENYRKAAYVMYECAMRVGTEMVSLSGLKQQLKCYLATLNALRLVNPDYAWIVKPVLKVIDCHQPNVPPGVSPKHTHDGEIVTPAKVCFILYYVIGKVIFRMTLH